MEVFKNILPLIEHLKALKLKGKSIGFVPTMGALHDGHLSLLASAKSENDVIVCSIYVNPSQFDNASDLKNYPRVLESDLELLKRVSCDVVFVPSDQSMYPQNSVINVDFGELGTLLEGEFRPNHFNGVALIVSKFFNIIQPDIAYFGQKDLQQFLIIKRLVMDLSFQIELRCVPTVREKDGLAKSSRNLRLTPEGRKKSLILNQSLQYAKEFLLNGLGSIQEAEEGVKGMIEKKGLQVDYFKIINADTLQSLNDSSFRNNKNGVAICVAAFVDEIRLIDNIIFSLKTKQ